MSTLPASKARSNLYHLIDEVSLHHKPVLIIGKRHNAVLVSVSEEDWSSIQSTLYLLSIPNMRDSIRKGLKIPLSRCDKDAGW